MVAAIAYNSPILTGIGKLRPSFRFQQAQAKQVTAAARASIRRGSTTCN